MLKTPKLSKKPSQALMQAIEDLKAVERMKTKYTIDMSSYHEPGVGNDNQCGVCFAGVVIARAGNDPKLTINPDQFDEDTAARLYGLDNFRSGNIKHGVENFALEMPRFLAQEIDMVDYHDDPKLFKKQLKELAGVLESYKL